jgi:tetratricopeptide (TPR) repeat protein
MDEGTLELLRCLQAGPYDESSWKQIRGLLRTQRRLIRAQQDASTLADLVQLLESWAQACDDPRIAAEALREAAEIAERELTNPALAADLRRRAVAVSHAGDKPRAGTNPHAALAQRKLTAGDLDGAIEGYERALNVEPDMEIVGRLAELYAQRGADGDAQQAADLYFTLGDVLGNPAGIPQLEQALAQVPDHAQARALLNEFTAGNLPQPEAATPRISRQRTIAGGAVAPVPTGLLQPSAAAENPPALQAPPPLRKLGGIRPKLRPGTKAPVISLMNKTPADAPTARAVGSAAIGMSTAPEREAATSIEPSLAPEPMPAAASRAPTSRSSVASLKAVVVDDEDALERSRERLQRMRARKRKIAITSLAGSAVVALAVVLIAPRSLREVQLIVSGTPTPSTGTTTTTQPATQPPPSAAPATPPPAAPEPPKAPEPAAAAPEPPPVVAPSEPAPKAAAPAPSVQLERAQFELRGGKWSDAQLTAAIDKLKPKLDQCYASALEKRPRLKGKLGVSWTVKPNGKAAAVKKQGGTLKDADLVHCTLDAIGNTHYPKPRKQAVSIKLPLEFRKTAG